MTKETNRKTNIPVKSVPQIVEWLTKNCTKEEIFFMADLAGDRKKFTILNQIFTRLTEYNLHEVFYTPVKSSEELSLFRASKRGEVAGLKAFSMACQAARLQVKEKSA